MNKSKRRVGFVAAFTLIADGLALAGAILLQSVWAVVVVLGCAAFSLYWFYVWRYEKRQVRYPLVPPEGRGDAYLPRTDIPRPIHEDFRRMQEKKRRLEKLRKMVRRKGKQA